MLMPFNVGARRFKGFPQVAATAISEEQSLTTTQTVDLPAGLVTGDLLIISMALIQEVADPAISVPSGWTQIVTHEDPYIAILYKTSDGLEGSSVDVTTNNCIGAFNSTRIEVGTWTGTPEATGATGTNSHPNPPSETASWGSDKNLWIATANHFRQTNLHINSAPSGFTGFITINSDFTGSSADVNCATAFLESETDAVNPGAFTSSSTSSTWWWSVTLVVQGN